MNALFNPGFFLLPDPEKGLMHPAETLTATARHHRAIAYPTDRTSDTYWCPRGAGAIHLYTKHDVAAGRLVPTSDIRLDESLPVLESGDDLTATLNPNTRTHLDSLEHRQDPPREYAPR